MFIHSTNLGIEKSFHIQTNPIMHVQSINTYTMCNKLHFLAVKKKMGGNVLIKKNPSFY